MVDDTGRRRLPLGNFRQNIEVNPRPSRPRPSIIKGFGGDKGGFNWIAFAIIVFLVIFGLNLIASGKLTEYVQETRTGFQEAEVGERLGLREIWNVITGQGLKKQEWDSYVVENEYLEDYGTHITRLNTPDTVVSGQDIILTGLAETGKLDDYASEESNVACELEGHDGEVIVEPERLMEDRRQTVLCTFVDGIDTNIRTTKQATLMVSYEFFSSGSWKAYFVSGDDYYKGMLSDLSDPYVSGDTVVPKHTDGPVKISIGAESSQPFIAGSDLVKFHVQITDNVAWEGRGDIREVKELYLHVPEENIELLKDVRLCDFRPTYEFDENGYHIYTLTSYGMHKANKECGLFEGVLVGQEYCENDFIDLDCYFRVKDFTPVWPDYENVLVDVRYVYETKSSTTVNIEPFTWGEDVCSFVEDEYECLDSVGCESVYESEDPETFKECRECDERYCSQYNEDRCFEDPCNLGDCIFDDNECKSEDSLV